MIDDPKTFEKVSEKYSLLLSCRKTLVQFLVDALRIKKRLIELDEFDKGPRNVMNYGHTYGHAIESATQFAIPHGIAVTIGMDMANYESMKRGMITKDFFESSHETLKKNYSDFSNVKFVDYSKCCLNQKNNNLVKTENLLRNSFKGIDLLMYSSGKTSFIDYGLKRKITLTNPSPFDISVIWSDPPRKMLCMEPWTSPRNSLGNGFRKIEIMPNFSKKLYSSIEVENL